MILVVTMRPVCMLRVTNQGQAKVTGSLISALDRKICHKCLYTDTLKWLMILVDQMFFPSVS